MGKLAGKMAIVTGASKGIGRAAAVEMLRCNRQELLARRSR